MVTSDSRDPSQSAVDDEAWPTGAVTVGSTPHTWCPPRHFRGAWAWKILSSGTEAPPSSSQLLPQARLRTQRAGVLGKFLLPSLEGTRRPVSIHRADRRAAPEREGGLVAGQPAGLTGLAVSEGASPAAPTAITNPGRARLGRHQIRGLGLRAPAPLGQAPICPLHLKVYTALCIQYPSSFSSHTGP